MSGVCSRASGRDPLEFTKFPVLFPDRREFAPWRPVRWGLHPPPRIHVFCRHVETRRKCPLTAGFSNASFESLVLRKGTRPISDLSLCCKKSRSWRRKAVVTRASPRSCRCWKRAASETCKCEDWNQGWARPSRSNCSDHSAGASRKLATPMPRGSRPSTAALTRAGAMNAIDIVMLT